MTMGYYYIGGVPYNERQWSIIIVTSVLVALSTLAVGLRLYARHTTGGRIHLDDICIVIALVSEMTQIRILEVSSC